MKKMIMAMLAFALAGSAFADTKTETVRLYDAASIYKPTADGRKLSGKGITLGNDYFLTPSYLTDNIYEMDISSFDFASIDSVKIRNIGGFTAATGAQELDKDIGAIKISFYEGGTGDAKADWNGSSLTLVKEISNVTLRDLTSGLPIDDLDFTDSDFLTFVISIDSSLVPEMPTSGEGIGIGGTVDMFQLSLTGTTSAVPEPSTYAAIFGALALGFAIYRRRK